MSIELKMQEELEIMIKECRGLSDMEIEGRGNGFRVYFGLIIDYVKDFRNQFSGQKTFNEKYSELQKELAVMVNEVSDFYKFPKIKKFEGQQTWKALQQK